MCACYDTHKRDQRITFKNRHSPSPCNYWGQNSVLKDSVAEPSCSPTYFHMKTLLEYTITLNFVLIYKFRMLRCTESFVFPLRVLFNKQYICTL